MVEAKKKITTKVIRPGKDVIAAKADSLRKKLLKTVGQDITKLVLDFSNVKALDPVGLSIIAATHNSLQNTGAQLTLKNVSEEFYNLFYSLGLNKHFEVTMANS